MSGSEQCQQMHAPELRRTQPMPATTGSLAGMELRDEVIRHIRIESFEQCLGADHGEYGCHVRTLTQSPALITPPVSA